MSRTGYRKPGIRYPNGRLVPSSYVRSKRISQEDLDAMIYPEGDMRNRPDARREIEKIRLEGPVKIARPLPSVWLGDRHSCPTCGHLTGV